MFDERTAPVGVRPGFPIREVWLRVSGPGMEPLEARGEIVTVGTASDNALVLKDDHVSRYHLEVRCDGDRVVVRDLGSTNGTSVGPVELRDASVRVLPGTTLRIGTTTLQVEHGEVAQVDAPVAVAGVGVLARSAAMRRVLGSARTVATRDVSVLIQGESGTGKELLARAMHDLGPRAHGPFVTVDCGAIPAHLVASELFGHERGAFTGADRKHEGAFERASRGTLFLDEIGELPREVQPTLLGALERHRFRRVGGTADVSVDLRVVAATHRDLRSAVNDGSFRLDLYHRLAVVTLSLPPLRERTEDLPVLIEHFLREEGYDGPVSALFDQAAIERLARRRWEGNVRELRNHVVATLTFGEEPALPPSGSASSGEEVEAQALGLPYREARRVVTERFERRYLEALLTQVNGNVRAAARAARMDRNYLTALLERHGLRGTGR
ncbi:MAG: sigma 54-interacting transcriptional regulator [Sandaracinus sp.]